MKTELLQGILKDVSRSFYLTIKILPNAVRVPIGLAYLLARISDTIADAVSIEPHLRLTTLRAFRDRVQGAGTQRIPWKKLATLIDNEAEARLLNHAEEALKLLRRSEIEDRKDIRRTVGIIISGQEFDLVHFEPHSETGALKNTSPRIIPLETSEEAEEYTYSVAGCVGEFWTNVCRRKLFPDKKLPISERQWRKYAISFGQGLQWVNILRDMPRDLRNGRCYIPAEKLRLFEITPSDLLDPKWYPKFKPLYHQYLEHAFHQLQEGWAYTTAIPFRQARIRIACALPLLIGAHTLKKLATENPLDPEFVIKISRKEVKRLMLKSVLNYAFPWAWKQMFPTSWTQLKEGKY